MGGSFAEPKLPQTQKCIKDRGLKFSIIRNNLGRGRIQHESSVLEQIPMGGYIISIFAQILGSLR